MDNNQSYLDKKKQQKAKSDAANTQAVQVAADVASKSGHPVAVVIGKGVKIADKISGGRASKALGKSLTTANKLAGPAGRKVQKLTNLAAGSGAGSGAAGRLASALSKNKSGVASSFKGKGNDSKPNIGANDAAKKETNKQQEESSSFGLSGIMNKAFIWGLIGVACLLPIVMVIICIFTVSSQIYISSIGLGQVDKLSDSDSASKIDKKSQKPDDNFDDEIEDENASVDFFLEDDKLIFRKSKLNSINFVQIATKKSYVRKYNEARLEEINDFYPAISTINDEGDERLAYDFFLKIFNIFHYYEDTYEKDPKDKTPLIDLPLLMSTLMLQSNDMNIIFTSNLEAEDRLPDLREQPVDDYRYDKDWSDYILKEDESTHDIEVLVQHMVSKQVRESCNDSNGKEIKFNILKDDEIGSQVLTCDEGQTYSKSNEYYAHDEDKYNEFLKEYIEKKYYINEDVPLSEEGYSGETTPSKSGPWSTWKQCDSAWGSILVPKSKLKKNGQRKNMCDIGCLITSVSIQIARSGTHVTVENFNPGVAVKKFSFVDGGNLVWASPSNVAPNFKYLTAISLVGMSKESVAKKLTSYDSSKYYIVLAVSKKNIGLVHHYITLDYVDKSTNNLYMYDPARTNTNDVYSIYKVYKAHIYEKKD